MMTVEIVYYNNYIYYCWETSILIALEAQLIQIIRDPQIQWVRTFR